MPTAATVPLAGASGTAGRPARCEATGSSSATSLASSSLSTSAETVARVSPVAAAMSARETGDGASSTCRRIRARLWWRRLSWRAARPRLAVLLGGGMTLTLPSDGDKFIGTTKAGGGSHPPVRPVRPAVRPVRPARLSTRRSDGSQPHPRGQVLLRPLDGRLGSCLLYTSDAADEEDSVDLGGRRIIKKK